LNEREVFFSFFKAISPYLTQKDVVRLSLWGEILKYNYDWLYLTPEQWADISVTRRESAKSLLESAGIMNFNDIPIRDYMARCYAMLGMFEEATIIFNEKIRYKNVAGFWTDYCTKHDYLFQRDASLIINSVPQPEVKKGIVFIIPDPGSLSIWVCHQMRKTSVLAAELKKAGYAVIHLFAGKAYDDPTGDSNIDRYSRSVPFSASDGQIVGDWVIEPDKGIISCNGLNFFNSVYERLGITLRRATIDWSSPIVNGHLESLIPQMDYCLRVCESIYNNITSKGIPTIFMSSPATQAPTSLFREFAFNKNDAGDSRIRFIHVHSVYQQYAAPGFQRLTGDRIDVLDMSAYRGSSVVSYPPEEVFELWYKEHGNSPDVSEFGKRMLDKKVAVRNHDIDNELPISMAKIHQAKQAGKKIVCFYGQYTCDFALPRHDGPAHISMRDWISHSVEVLSNHEDFLVLIKPHPIEEHPETTLVGTEKFREFLPDKLPKNVIYLAPSDYNNIELFKYLDLAVCWFGTSPVEMCALGVPVLVCSHFGQSALPIEMHYPKNRADYSEYLLKGQYMPPSQETKQKALALISYIGMSVNSCSYPYISLPLTNLFRLYYWHSLEVKNYLRNGDPNLSKLAAKIVKHLPIN